MGTISKSNSKEYLDINGFKFKTEYFSLNSSTSPVSNGKVDFRTNAGTIKKGRAKGYTYDGYTSSLTSAGSAVLYTPLNSTMSTIANSKCAERFRTEVSTKANLAVSLAQINKTRDNAIRHAEGIAAKVNSDLDRLEQLYPGYSKERRHRRGRMFRQSTRQTSRAERAANTAAGAYLEAVFGWLPLVDEFNNQMANLQKVPPYRLTIRVSGKETATSNGSSDGGRRVWNNEQTTRVRYRTTMVVQNPNSFLAHKSGITNYASALWDLVPWSFVVNMFTNIGHMINSLRPIEGVTFEDACRTQRLSTIYSYSYVSTSGKGAATNAFGYVKTIDSVMPPISFRLRTPQLNGSLAAIGLSLAVQKISRISRPFVNG